MGARARTAAAARTRRGQAGETIVEVLVAMTVACLAMVMLAMAISSSTSIVTQGASAAQTYYAQNNGLDEHTVGSTADAAVTVTARGFGDTPLERAVPVDCTGYANDAGVPGGGDAVVYAATELAAG